jgi:hypothetical protein
MKLTMERWRNYLLEVELREKEPAAPQPQSAGQKAASMLGRVRGMITKGFDKMDTTLQKDYCINKFPELLHAQGDLETWGDLLATLKCGIGYKDKKAFLDILTSQVPGLNAVKSIFANANSQADFILKMYQVDDDARPSGNISKLDMDDYVSKMLDKGIEREFIEHLIKAIGARALDDKIPDDWDITKELEEYLRQKNSGRTIEVPQ